MKTTFALILAMLLGLIACTSASAQVFDASRVDLSRLRTNPALLEGLRARPALTMPGLRPVPAPAARPSVIPQLPSGINPGLLGNLRAGGFVPEARPGMVQIPPGPLVEYNPGLNPGLIPPMPMPTFPGPSTPPAPSPSPSGPGIHFGPQGPSISFGTGGGNRMHVPLPGRFRQRFAPPAGYQTPTQVLGYGPRGEVYTGNGQVTGSAYTPGRNMSQLNGSQRNVEQPIYDGYGNIVGYQRGTVWQNSMTGQQHGNMTTYTPNGTGGSHQSTTLYSTAGGNITPIRN